MVVPPSSRGAAFDLDAAYAVEAELVRRRRERGDLVGEVVRDGVHHRQRCTGVRELGLGVPGVLDLVRHSLLTQRGGPGVVAHDVGDGALTITAGILTISESFADPTIVSLNNGSIDVSGNIGLGTVAITTGM